VLANHAPLFPVIEIKEYSYRLSVQLHVLYRFLPLENLYLDGLPLVPMRAEMVVGNEGFVEIFFWDRRVLRVDLSFPIVSAIHDCTLGSR
jgi:hypothetical protein